MSPDDPTLQETRAAEPESNSGLPSQDPQSNAGESQAPAGEPHIRTSEGATNGAPAVPEPPPAAAPADVPPTEAAPVEAAAAETPPTDAAAVDVAPPEVTPAAAAADVAGAGGEATAAAVESSSSEPPPASPAVAESAPTAERPRVSLNPTGSQDAKAVPSFQNEESAGAARGSGDDSDKPVEAPRPTAPPPPVTGVEIPRSAELDPEMEAELTAAMAVNPLSATLNENTAGGTPTPDQPVDIETLQPGAKLKGTIQIIGEETVFVDLGLRSPGMIQTRQFPAEKPPEIGQQVDVVVDRVDAAEGTVLVSLPKARRKPAGNWDAVAQGQIVDVMVTKTNKGGLEVSISNLRGFLPASQVDLGFVENLESYVGQKLTCLITEVNPQKRNLVVSRRAFLQQERQEKEKELWQQLEVNQSLDGTVKTIKDYGAFVDLGGVDGFLHVGEISWNRIGHPGDVLKVGDVIRVRILKLDPESKKIGLGMKQLQQNPWGSIEEKYPVGATVSGTVTRTTDFGAFVELEQGVEGLIHISELEHRRVGRVTDIVNEGDQVDAKVLLVDPARKRISLSLKALKTKPEPAAASAPAAEPYERKRKGPLRGGKESDSGGRGGLFGNPDDFR